MSRPRGAGRCLDISPAPTGPSFVSTREISSLVVRERYALAFQGFRPFVAMAQLGEPRHERPNIRCPLSQVVMNRRCRERVHSMGIFQYRQGSAVERLSRWGRRLRALLFPAIAKEPENVTLGTQTEEKFEPGLIRYWVLRALGATATALGIGR
jgi:hypothetical protein